MINLVLWKNNMKMSKMYPYILLFIPALFLSMQSYYAPFANNINSYDASTFAYIGWAMKNGSVLYVDVWENKGPLLYMINFVGMLINERYGIYILELAALFICAVFLYKTAYLISNKKVAVISSSYCIFMLGRLLEGGNFCEEYALPFMSAALYYFIKYYFQDYRLEWNQTMTIGVCFAACLLLRANLATFFVPFAAVIFFHSLSLRRFKNCAAMVWYFLIGAAAAVFIPLIYLIKNNALSACLESAYFSPLDFSVITGGTRLKNLYDMFADFNLSGGFTLIVLFFVMSLVYFKINSGADVRYVLICISFNAALILNAVANSLTGVYHPHYFMSFIPMIVLPASFAFHFLHKIISPLIKNSGYPEFLSAFAVFFLMTYISWNSIDLTVDKFFINVNDENSMRSGRIEYILSNTDENDLVQILGGYNSPILFNSRRKSASRYFYQPTWGSFKKGYINEVIGEVMNDVMEKKPKVIIIKETEVNRYFTIIDGINTKEFINEYYTEDLSKDGAIFYKLK